MREEKKATRQSYGEALVELGNKNKDIVVLDADLAAATKTDMFAKEFPNRFFDMGIAEQNMIATAAEDEESAFEKAYSGLRGWVDCFEKAELKGIVTGGGIAAPNDASNHKDTMQKAYELGMGL